MIIFWQTYALCQKTRYRKGRWKGCKGSWETETGPGLSVWPSATCAAMWHLQAVLLLSRSPHPHSAHETTSTTSAESNLPRTPPHPAPHPTCQGQLALSVDSSGCSLPHIMMNNDRFQESEISLKSKNASHTACHRLFLKPTLAGTCNLST